jgi:predicted AlkP superfamily phosphohydrolase/phosphomutase
VGSVALVVFDGLDPGLLESYCESLNLPNASKMYGDERLGRMNSTIPAKTSPAAFCLYTGCNPARNGPTDMKKSDGKTPYSRHDLETTPFWELLDDDDFYVLGARFTGPVPKHGSAFVSDFPPDFRPKELEEEILDPLEGLDPPEIKPKDVEAAATRYLKNVEIMEEKTDAEFKLIYVGLTDSLQHSCWYEEELRKEIYKQADRMMGELEEVADDVVFASDHGHHGRLPKNVHLNNLFERNGLVERSKSSKLLDFVAPTAKWLIPDNYMKPLWDLVKSSKEEETNGTDDGLSLTIKRSVPGLNMSTAEAFCSCVYGVDVKSGKVEEVESMLQEFEVNGKNPVKEIYRREELYEGPFIDRVPELLLLFEDGYRAYHLFGTSDTSPTGKEGGSHVYAREAVFGVSEGLQLPEERPDIWDVLPSALGLMGVELKGVDGEDLGLGDRGPDTILRANEPDIEEIEF